LSARSDLVFTAGRRDIYFFKNIFTGQAALPMRPRDDLHPKRNHACTIIYIQLMISKYINILDSMMVTDRLIQSLIVFRKKNIDNS